jgi:hypothetical protein
MAGMTRPVKAMVTAPAVRPAAIKKSNGWNARTVMNHVGLNPAVRERTMRPILECLKKEGQPLAASSRMLKKSASFVLASFRGSTYRKAYASPLHSLRPRWTAFLTILPGVLLSPETCCL